MQKSTVKRLDLSNVKRGDKFVRMIGGEIPDTVVVGDMDETFIWVGSEHGEVSGTKEDGWKFRRNTSTEVDEELGFDGITATISYLTPYTG